ncbi:MAG: hypothetical protein WCE46_04750 [Methanoregula sp.]|uniref:hypothetical protein n=1 Tax=Methanoregula sp. TaxID=2052170 RepID=UPI003C77C1A7
MGWKESEDPVIGRGCGRRIILINLPSDFARDSAFPFKPGEELIARIEGKK